MNVGHEADGILRKMLEKAIEVAAWDDAAAISGDLAKVMTLPPAEAWGVVHARAKALADAQAAHAAKVTPLDPSRRRSGE